MNELTQKTLDIAQFDTAKKSVTEMVVQLTNCLVTSPTSRDKLFEMCKASKRTLTLADDKRKDFNRPIADKKKELKAQYDADIEPLDKRKADIEDYVKTLKEPLTEALESAKTRIMRWDEIQVAMKAKELAKIEAEKKAQREKEEREEKERQDKINAENKRIEDERLAGIAEANRLSGIEARKAQFLAEKKAREDKEQLEKDAIKADAQARIDNQVERSNINDSAKKIHEGGKGQKKVFFEIKSVTDINLVPDRYIIKSVDMNLAKRDVKEGLCEIPGFEIVEKSDLQFKKSRV